MSPVLILNPAQDARVRQVASDNDLAVYESLISRGEIVIDRGVYLECGDEKPQGPLGFAHRPHMPHRCVTSIGHSTEHACGCGETWPVSEQARPSVRPEEEK